MRCARIGRWSGAYLPPRNPRISSTTCSAAHRPHAAQTSSSGQLSHSRSIRSFRTSSSKAAALPAIQQLDERHTTPASRTPKSRSRHIPPAPANPAQFQDSTKLAALHARLSLPARLPLKTLARCLRHESAYEDPSRNNTSLALLGQDLIAHFTAEWLICHYPRLPMTVLYAAQYAYSGDKTLTHMTREWGVEAADAIGPEVDAGYLQFGRVTPGNAMAADQMHLNKHLKTTQEKTGTTRPDEGFNQRRGISSRIVYDDEFGDLRAGINIQESALGLDADVSGDLSQLPQSTQESSLGAGATTHEAACASFIRAVFGALYLHSGAQSTIAFHKAHILSRHLELHKLFQFRHPAQDLVRLCDREGMEPPVARLISETGRKSRSPVFVVGVFSGNEKLGEDAGGSLHEGRVRAAANALRSWYLYSPPKDQIRLPSQHTNGSTDPAVKKWLPQFIDRGEIVA